jgi:hypothetical protein
MADEYAEAASYAGHKARAAEDYARTVEDIADQWKRKYYAAAPGAAPPRSAATVKPDWLKNIKTKAEAKKAYRAAARKHHPDRPGGSKEKMQDINASWEHWADKFASVHMGAFASELVSLWNR